MLFFLFTSRWRKNWRYKCDFLFRFQILISHNKRKWNFRKHILQKSRILFLIRFFFGNIKKILDDNAQNQVRMCSSQHTVVSVYKLITETRSLDCVINIIRCYIPFNVYYVRQCRAELYGMEWKTKWCMNKSRRPQQSTEKAKTAT